MNNISGMVGYAGDQVKKLVGEIRELRVNEKELYENESTNKIKKKILK